MPDLLSHLIIGLILAEVFNIKKKSLVVLGALLPDLFAKFDLIFFYTGIEKIFTFASFHTPIMFFLLSILIAVLFRYSRLKTILFLNIGSMSHFLSDLTIKHFSGAGIRIFFPFSMKNYSLSLIWPEQSIYVLVISLFIYGAIRIYKKKSVLF